MSDAHPRSAEPDGPTVMPPAADVPATRVPASGNTPVPGQWPDALPAPFGRYQLQRLLGRGGMGAVYLAHDPVLDRPVAVKIPNPGLLADPTQRGRFLREARAAATLSHPNICPVHDAGEIGGVYFLAMSYLEGQSLAAVIPPGQGLPARQAVTYVGQLALAMQEAHAKGIIHRDLKPANVIITAKKQAVVMDFGLAHRAQPGDTRLTQSGMLLGTPAYMPPEQVNGDLQAIGPASDVYSLGVILYEALTGRPPFQGPCGTVLAQIVADPPPPLRQFKPDLDPALEALCLKALAKAPADRYASMKAFAAALSHWLKGHGSGRAVAPVAAAPPPPVDPLADLATVPLAPRPRGARRGPGAGTWLVVGGLALAVSALGVGLRLRHPPPPEQAAAPTRAAAPATRAARPSATKPAELSDPERIAAGLARAREHLAGRRYLEAVAAASQALQLNANNLEALVLRGRAYAGAGEGDLARRDLDRALELSPQQPDALLARAELHLARKHWRKALADADTVAQGGLGDHGLARCLRGVARAQLGAAAEALEDLDAGLKLTPGAATFLFYRGLVHARLGHAEQARADLEQARKLDPLLAQLPPALGEPPLTFPGEELAAGKIRAPDLATARKLFHDDFRNPDSGFPRGMLDDWCKYDYAKEGYVIRHKEAGDYTSTWNTPWQGGNFACRLKGRSAVAGNWWGLALEKVDGDTGVRLLVGGEGQIQALSLDGKITYLEPTAHPAIRPATEANALLVIRTGRQLELYVNDVAVCQPFLLEEDFPALLLQLTAQTGPAGQAEFTAMTVWATDGLGRRR